MTTINIKIKKILPMLVIIGMSSGLEAKPKEKEVTIENRAITSFHSIEASSAFKVFLVPGDKESLRVEADATIQKQIITEVRNNVLHLYTKGDINNPVKMNIYVSFKELEGIEASGAVTVRCDSVIQSKDFKINLSGASRAHLKLKAQNFLATLSGASKLHISGTSEKVELEMSGASKCNAFHIESKDILCEVSGAAKLFILAQHKIRGEASGASAIVYKGTPSENKIEVSGVAKLKQSKGKEDEDDKD